MTLTVHELIELLEELIKLIRKARQSPPAAVKDLHGAVNRSNTMSTVTLNWDDPTVRADTPPTPLPPTEIAFVDIFDTSTVDPSNPKIGSVPGAGTTFLTNTLAVGFHNFTVVVQDTTGHRSAASNVFSCEIKSTLAPPAAVTNLTGTINPDTL
jgi:hypothetical protein